MNLSVIIPTYKRADALRRNLDALIQAKMPCFEIIIGDDSGDSATLSVLKEFSFKLPIQHLPPEGKGSLASNISRLIESVSGDWTFLIHDDDFVTGDHSNYLKQFYNDYDFVFSDHWVSNENGIISEDLSSQNSKQYYRQILPEGLQHDAYKLMLNQSVCLDGFYIRTSILKKYKPKLQFGSVADYYWIFQILTSGIRIGYSKQRTFAYTLSSEGLTGSGLNEDIVAIYSQLIKDDFEGSRIDIYKRRVSLNTWHAVNTCIRKKKKQRAWELLKAINFNYIDSFKHKILMPLQVLWLVFK